MKSCHNSRPNCKGRQTYSTTCKQAQVAGMAGMLWQLNWRHINNLAKTQTKKTDIYIYNGTDEEQLGGQVTRSDNL